MNKQILAAALATLCGAAMFAVPALAQRATTTQTRTQTAARQVDTTGQPSAQRAVPPVDSRMCIRETGSHIPAPKGKCLPVVGNSYSQQDLRRTGAPDLGRALQMLDPSVTIGH